MIYIVTFNINTGGPETAHQTAQELLRLGEDVAMFYLDAKRGVSLYSKCGTPEAYLKYDLPVAHAIVDSPNNTVLIPETAIQLINRLSHARICVMWLSLGNYLKVVKQYSDRSEYAEQVVRSRGLPKWCKPLIKLRSYRFVSKNGFYYDFSNAREDIHTYNCEYARQYIAENGVPSDKMTYLCGPISSSFSKMTGKLNSTNRSNIIAYNPKKGIDFTKKIIKTFQLTQNLDARFVPIANMTPNEVSTLLSCAKVYIDFGDFPGPERIPREAVCMGCNIITSKSGAAGNKVDVPIDDDLKIDVSDDNIPQIVNLIRNMLIDYDSYCNFYDEYRLKVSKQISDFPNQVARLVELIHG